MKTRFVVFGIRSLAILLLLAPAGIPPARAQSAAFAYQGRLLSGAQPADGSFDFQFAVFRDAIAGTQSGPTLTNPAVTVSNGVFAVTLDFGSGIFGGANLWLQIGVRTNGNDGPFTIFSPLQPVQSVPYAVIAGNVSGPISGNGAGLTNLNWNQISGLPTTLAGYGITNAITAADATGLVTNFAQPRTTNLNYLSSLPLSSIPAAPPGVQADEFQTPPMGYNSFYDLGSAVSEYLLTNYITEMATNGMAAAGYTYFCLDDGWAGARDANGDILATLTNASYSPLVPESVVTNVFPHGIAFLADYAHRRGMKMGLYMTVGTDTCANYTGSEDHIPQDVQTFANWGIDYLKVETCSLPSTNNVLERQLYNADIWGWAKSQYEATAVAIQGAHRPMFLNVSWWWNMEPWLASEVNSYRGAGDVRQTHDTYANYVNELYHLDFIAYYSYLTGPGHFVDPDVILASTQYTPGELRSIVSAFAMLSAPLFVDSPVANVNIMTNPAMISIDQDPLVMPAHTIGTNAWTTNVWISEDSQFTWPVGADQQVWVKNLQIANGPKKAVLFLNRGTNAVTLSINWADAGIPPNVSASVYDCWSNAYAGNFVSNYTATVDPVGCVLLIINSGSSVPTPPATGQAFLSDLGWLDTSFCGRDGMSGMYKDQQYDGGLYPGWNPAVINGTTYQKALGSASPSSLNFYLGGVARRFHSDYGHDRHSDATLDYFQVWGDGVKLFDSGPAGFGLNTVDISVAGVTNLSLVTVPVSVVGPNDLVDWGNCYVVSALAGDGGGLTNLNAANLTGTIADSSLSPNVALLNANQTFTGINNFTGTVGIGVANPTQSLQVNGNILASGTITGSSDRNLKENFASVDPLTVLDRVSTLRISEWNYKADAGVRHLGPMAQDFYSAFSLGLDDKHISMVDADGVALAAIQGLNEKLKEQAAQLNARDAEIIDLKTRLEALEGLVLRTNQAR